MGERIRYYRQIAGLTQKSLAEKCGIAESAIRNYELGNRMPDWETLTAIAENLEISYFSLSDPDLTAMYGALHTFFRLEDIYGLHPEMVDGKVHLVFRDETYDKNPLDFSADEQERQPVVHGLAIVFVINTRNNMPYQTFCRFLPHLVQIDSVCNETEQIHIPPPVMPFHKHATDFSQRILGHAICRTFKTLNNRVAQRNDVCFIFYKGLDFSDDQFFVLFEISINYTVLLIDLGQLEKAYRILTKLSSKLEAAKLEMSLDRGLLLEALGSICVMQGDTQQAKDYLQAAMEIFEICYEDEPQLLEQKRQEVRGIASYDKRSINVLVT